MTVHLRLHNVEHIENNHADYNYFMGEWFNTSDISDHTFDFQPDCRVERMD